MARAAFWARSVRRPSAFRRGGWRGGLRGGIASLAMVAAASSAGGWLQQSYGIRSPVLLMLLLAVLISAVRYGLLTSLLACLCSAAVFDFFFIEPFHAFTIARSQDVVAFAVFCAVAVAASEQAARLREQTLAAERRTAFVAALYRLGGALAGCLTRHAVIETVLAELAATLGAELRYETGAGEFSATPPTAPVGQRAPPSGPVFTLLLGERLLGEELLGQAQARMRLRRAGAAFSDTDRSLAGAMIGLLDLALARVALAGQVEQARIAAANQALTATLLNCISHDLRSPLAGILAAADSLAAASPGQSAAAGGDAADVRPSTHAAAAESVRTIRTEAERLNRLAVNLLNMLRLDGGHLRPRLRVEDVADVINAVAARSRALLGGHDLRLSLPPDLPWVRVDPALFEPILFNLLDNAAKFAPAGSTIELGAREVADGVEIYVRDEGPGLPPTELDRVFEKFVRLPTPAELDGEAEAGRGAGLGLAICRGFVDAMGGSITAGNRNDRAGAVITVRLPAVALAGVPELSDL